MTALADRLKVLKEAMTQGKWSLGCTFDAASFVNAGKECVAKCDNNDRHKYDATVIALGDLFIPVVMALEACADEASSWIEQHYTADVRKYASEQRRYERDNACVLEARALLAQIADRLTGASQ